MAFRVLRFRVPEGQFRSWCVGVALMGFELLAGSEMESWQE